MRVLVVALAMACGAVWSLWPAGRPAAAQSSGVAVLPAGCFLLDGNGAFVSGIRSGNEIAITVRDDGSIEAACRVRLAAAADGGPRTWTFANTGQTCAVLIDGELIQTESWEETVSADGIGVLVCRVAAETSPRAPPLRGEGCLRGPSLGYQTSWRIADWHGGMLA